MALENGQGNRGKPGESKAESRPLGVSRKGQVHLSSCAVESLRAEIPSLPGLHTWGETKEDMGSTVCFDKFPLSLSFQLMAEVALGGQSPSHKTQDNDHDDDSS